MAQNFGAGTLQSLAPIITVPRRFWDREYGGCPLPKAVNVAFEVAGQQVDDVSAHGYVSVAEDSELRLSGLWGISQDRFPGHLVIGWSKIGDDTIKLQLQPPDDEPNLAIDRKRQAPADLPEPQAKLQALSARQALEWESPRDQLGHASLMDWRQEGRDGARFAAEPPQRLVSPTLLPAARLQQRRGGQGGRTRGGSRSSATGRGCAKLVRTTTRLYIGVGQVREWLGEVGARTELQVKVMLDNRMLFGNHQADLLYNKGAHYYWITSRTLKRTAMGKWFLGWSHTPTDGLVLLLRSPSKDEIAAAIAEGFQGKDDDEDTEVSEQQQQIQQQMQQQMLLALSPPSPLPNRVQQTRSLSALAYTDEEAMLLMQQQQQQQTPASEMEDMADGGQYRQTAFQGAARFGAGGGGGDDDDAVSGLSGDSELRRALGPSDPRLMVALAAAELQRGLYGSNTPGGGGGSQNLNRRPALGHGAAAGLGPSRQYPVARDVRDAPHHLVGSRPQSGSATPGSGGAQAQYREPPAGTGSEGLNAPAAAVTPGGGPRSAATPPPRFTNFAEVPGGTAFANVTLPADALALDPPLPLGGQHQPQQRGGAANVPSQLGATTSIASNLSLGGTTQMTGTASMLQASGVAGPIAAPLRLPTNVSELLPPEYLPAAVSVRCTLDGNLQPEIFACEIHRSRQGHCYLYNLPPSVLEGRSQQDWMISEDGCLVLCLKTVAQGQALVENKSVRSNPSNQQAGALPGGTSVNAESPTAARPTPLGRTQSGMDKPIRPQRKNSDEDLATAAAAAVKPQPPDVAPSPKGPELQQQLPQPQEGQGFETAAAAAGSPAPEPQPVVASLLVPERKVDSRRERPPQLLVPRQAIESLYGLVELPHPVLVRFQINEEPEQQVYLAEVADMGGDQLIIRGTPSDALVGRTLVGWRRAFVLSHQLLVVCLETRQDAAAQAKAGTASVPARGGREGDVLRARGEPVTGPGTGGTPASGAQQQQQQPQPQSRPVDQWGTSVEVYGAAAGLRQLGGAAANPFASAQQQQVSLSGVAAPSSGSHPSHRAFVQQHQPAAAPTGAGPRQQQPALQQRRPSGDSSAVPGLPQHPLQPVFSALLPGVGSSKLPPSNSIVNNSSNSLLPAQASNLPFTSSVRPDGLGSAATGGGAGAGARPVNAGARGAGGSTAGGAGVCGHRAAPLDVDSRAGATLQTVASATQSALQAPGSSRPPAAARAAPVFAWPMEVGAGAQVSTPTVFAQFGPNLGLGQEPSSPKAGGAAELSQAAPPKQRPHQQAGALPRVGGGGGGGAAGPHSTGNDGTLMPRNTAQTADFSAAVVGSQPLNGQQHQQHESLHGTGRQAEDVEMELRKSPPRSGAGALGGGEQDAAATSRGRWQQGGGAEQKALAASGSTHTMRYLPTQGIHRGGSGGVGTETSGHAAAQDGLSQPPRLRSDRPQPHSPWRFEVQPPSPSHQQQQQQPEDDLAAPAPSLASLPAGGLGQEGRWGNLAAASPDVMTQGVASEADDPRAHLSGRYGDEAYVAVSSRPRPGADVDDMVTGVEEAAGPGPAAATAPSPRRGEAYDTRPHQGFVRSGDAATTGAGSSGAGDAATRHAYEATAEPEDVEMEEAGPAAVVLPPVGRQENHGHPNASGLDEQARSAGRGTDLGGEGHEALAIDHQHNQGMSSWQRKGEAGQVPPEALVRQGYDQQSQQQQPQPAPAAAEPSSRHRSGSAGAGPLEHSAQAQGQWRGSAVPRLDLTGATKIVCEHGLADGATCTKGEDRAGRSRSDDGENGDRPPPRRFGVLRMLSVVVHEPDEGDNQLQQRQQEQQQPRRN